MPRLLSVNVGLPRDVTWNGKTVRTSVWKSPVDGRRMVRTLDIDGDAQADLAGHGGEHRAVFVYQMDSYHYWDRFLGRPDLAPQSHSRVAGLPPLGMRNSGACSTWRKRATFRSRWPCRTGVCHTCMTGLIGGSILYIPEPLEKPATGNVLVCCSSQTRVSL